MLRREGRQRSDLRMGLNGYKRNGGKKKREGAERSPMLLKLWS